MCAASLNQLAAAAGTAAGRRPNTSVKKQSDHKHLDADSVTTGLMEIIEGAVRSREEQLMPGKMDLAQKLAGAWGTKSSKALMASCTVHDEWLQTQHELRAAIHSYVVKCAQWRVYHIAHDGRPAWAMTNKMRALNTAKKFPTGGCDKREVMDLTADD